MRMASAFDYNSRSWTFPNNDSSSSNVIRAAGPGFAI
jgi:hypothetical protein